MRSRTAGPLTSFRPVWRAAACALLIAATFDFGWAQQFDTRDEALSDGERIAVLSPSMTGSINLQGARLDDLTMFEPSNGVVAGSILLSPSTGPQGYFVEFGWIANGSVPGPRSRWSAPAGLVLTPSTPITLTFGTDTGLVFIRTISVDDGHLFTVKDQVVNASTQPASLTPYGRAVVFSDPDYQRDSRADVALWSCPCFTGHPATEPALG